MFDKDTGKPRGFAFCEYSDIETASSAIRNLNGFDINGRGLKVDYADSEMPMGPNAIIHGSGQQPHSASTVNIPGAAFSTSLEAINSTLTSLSNQQLIDLIGQAKALAIANPEQARLLLQSNPQLTFALFQAMLLTNLVEQRVVQQIMHSLPSNLDNPSASKSPPSPPLQQDVLKQILSMKEEQINSLPPEQQSQVRSIRSQYQKQ